MNNEIKMSDVFGRVIADADTLIAHGYGTLADFSGYKRECRYVAHAINNHDRMAEENKRLREVVLYLARYRQHSEIDSNYVLEALVSLATRTLSELDGEK